jgi:hypothetical protein
VADAAVVLTWIDVGFQKGVGVTTRRRFEQARTAKSGFFSFCDLDDRLEAVVSAASGQAFTSDVRVSLEPDQLAAHTLFLPDTNDSGAPAAFLRGSVRTISAGPIGGARADIFGFTDSARTRSDGVFAMNVRPLGTQTLRVRSVGYDEFSAPVDLIGGETTTVATDLPKTPQSLETVLIRERRETVSERTGFTRRSLSGPGRYITGADIARRRLPCLLDNIEWVQGFWIANRRNCLGDIAVRERGVSTIPGTRADVQPSCATVYIDEQEVTSDAVAQMPPSEVVGIELYRPNLAPLRYSSGCGVVLVWTTRYNGPRR